jgi:hypothetical protein
MVLLCVAASAFGLRSITRSSPCRARLEYDQGIDLSYALS